MPGIITTILEIHNIFFIEVNHGQKSLQKCSLSSLGSYDPQYIATDVKAIKLSGNVFL